MSTIKDYNQFKNRKRITDEDRNLSHEFEQYFYDILDEGWRQIK